MLACAVRYRAVPRSWFAIWFANSAPSECPLTPPERTSERLGHTSAVDLHASVGALLLASVGLSLD